MHEDSSIDAFITVPDFAEIQETFALLDDWEERYRYVIELGRDMPALPDTLKNQTTKVDGCASQVWIVPHLVQEANGQERLYFNGDSDAHIVRGLIAILRSLLSGRLLEEIREANPEVTLNMLGLDGALSTQRANGLRAMVLRIQALAASREAP